MYNVIQKNIQLLIIVIVVLAAGSVSSASTLVIDSMQYGSDSAAQAAWPAYNGAPAVIATTQDGVQCVEFPCSFTESIGLDPWNKTTSLNLSNYNYVCFKCKISRPWLVGSIVISFWSGSSYFSSDATFVPMVSDQWQTIMMPLSSFTANGTPSWSNITRITLWCFSHASRSVANVTGTTNVYVANLQAQTKDHPNMLMNSGFETCTTGTIPDGWGGGDWMLKEDAFSLDNNATWNSKWGIDSTTSKTGMNSLRIQCNPSYTELLAASIWVPVVQGQPYTLSAWMKSDKPETLPVTVQLNGIADQQVNVTTTWQRFLLSNVVPTESGNTKCYIIPNSTGTLWIDDVQLEQDTTATAWAPADTDATLDVAAVHRTPTATNNAVITPGGSSISVSIDANKRFIVNGGPFIPYAMGWSTADISSTMLQAMAQAGFNTVCIITSGTAATLAPVLENVNAVGLKAIVWFNRDTMDAAAMQTMASTLISNYPAAAAAVIAWYVYDEPFYPEDYTVATANYNAVKAVDSMRPVYVNYTSFCTSVIGDIASSDDYPIPLAYPSQIGLDASHFAGTGKLGWIWLQACGYAYFLYRDPTGPEEECMCYSALINGARGILYWTNTPYSMELWGEMKQLAPEIKALTPVLYSLETAPTVSSSTPGIELIGKTYSAQPYVISVNDSPSSVSATLNVPSGYVSASVLFENRYVSISSAAIVDTFEGFQRHVYRLLTQALCGLNVNVTLQDYSGDLSLLPIRVDLLQNDNVVYTTTVMPASNPATITFTDIPAGSYYVRAEAAGFLLPNMPLVSVSANTYTTQNVSLVNGDVECDGIIRSSDVGIVQKNLGKTNQ